MILDSSVLVAILNDEPDAPDLVQAMRDTRSLSVSGPSVLETAIAAGRLRDRGLDELLAELEVTIVPFGREHIAAAREAYARYGKRSGSPARLNFGDCMSYAVAKVTGEPLLFKGDDFTHTDVEAAYLP